MSIEAFTKLIPEYEGYPDEAIIRIECSVRELRQTANKISAQPERVSVPREPTREMLDAICSVRFKQGAEIYREIYKTMIAAAQEGK